MHQLAAIKSIFLRRVVFKIKGGLNRAGGSPILVLLLRSSGAEKSRAVEIVVENEYKEKKIKHGSLTSKSAWN